MAHPLRLRILRLCLHEQLTNKELADRLGQEPATILHHVRTLCRTGFLEAGEVRNGRRGALEKPYRSTGKSWVLSVDHPADRLTSVIATIDAMRDEISDAGPTSIVRNSRLGLRLSAAEADELGARIDELVEAYAARPPTVDGDRYGLSTSRCTTSTARPLHRRTPSPDRAAWSGAAGPVRRLAWDLAGSRRADAVRRLPDPPGPPADRSPRQRRSEPVRPLLVQRVHRGPVLRRGHGPVPEPGGDGRRLLGRPRRRAAVRSSPPGGRPTTRRTPRSARSRSRSSSRCAPAGSSSTRRSRGCAPTSRSPPGPRPTRNRDRPTIAAPGCSWTPRA